MQTIIHAIVHTIRKVQLIKVSFSYKWPLTFHSHQTLYGVVVHVVDERFLWGAILTRLEQSRCHADIATGICPPTST